MVIPFFKVLVFIILGAWGATAFALDQAPGVTAFTEVFGDGQKLSYLVLEYPASIRNDSVTTGTFSVADHQVVRAYTNSVGNRTSTGTDGPFVILELQTQPGPDLGEAAGQAQKPGTSDGPPPGFGGPKLGEKSDKPATAPVIGATVYQREPLVQGNGTVLAAASGPWASQKTLNLMTGDFQQRIYVDPRFPGEPLMYNLYVPRAYNSQKKYPLVLFIHDAGAVSNNPTETLTQGLGAVVWASPKEQAKHECFVLAPQYDRVIADDSSTTSDQMEITVDLVKALETQYSLDPNRLYNTGQSMGGMTSIAMDIKYPGLFAASLLVACQWDPALTAPLARKPLWIVVSEGDTKAKPGQEAIVAQLQSRGSTVTKQTWSALSSVQEFKGLTDAMVAAKTTINFTVFQGGSHRYTWQYAYGIEGIRDWLLAQTKDHG